MMRGDCDVIVIVNAVWRLWPLDVVVRFRV